MFRKKISQEKFIDLLLEVKYKIEQLFIKAFKKDLFFDYNGTEKELIFEARILSLWIVTLSIPPTDDNLKDMLHDKLCKYLGTDDKTKQYFFEEIDKRYKNYYKAFDMWQKNPQRGDMVGTVIIETIKNQNPDFSLSKKMPLVGDIEALMAFELFGKLFQLSLKMVGEIKKKYKIENA